MMWGVLSCTSSEITRSHFSAIAADGVVWHDCF
jgi:hypothetical protein